MIRNDRSVIKMYSKNNGPILARVAFHRLKEPAKKRSRIDTR
jgi:hypothetical protein